MEHPETGQLDFFMFLPSSGSKEMTNCMVCAYVLQLKPDKPLILQFFEEMNVGSNC